MKVATALLIFFLIYVLCHASSPQEIINGEYIVPRDTITLDDNYSVIIYGKQDSAGNKDDKTNVLRIFKNKRTLITIDEGTSRLIDFCYALRYIEDDCFLQDINHDGLKEILVHTQSCCRGGHVYSLDDSLKEIFEIIPMWEPFELKDMDHDSIPEIITWDEAFQSFYGYPYAAFPMRLIWRWDGTKYRIANARYSRYYDFLSNLIHDDTISVYRGPGKRQLLPGMTFWYTVIDHYYSGRPAKGDSVFNEFWPASVPGKDEYYREFKRRIDSDPYWPQIMNSNW